MRIREAVPGDADAIASLKVRAWRAAYDGILSDLDRLDAVREVAGWRGYIEDRPADDRLWLAEENGAVVGYARTGGGEVHGLYVDPDLIGTGIGRALFEFAVADLRDRGAESVVVWHFVGNDRAAAFYERAGFTLDGARKASDFGVDEVRRRRTW